MLSELIKNLKAGLGAAFKGKGKNDELDTVVRGLVSKFVKSFAKKMRERFDVDESSASMVGTASIIVGWVLRKVTNLGTFADNVITDIAQEIADQFSEISKKTGDTPEKTIDKKRLMANIAKLIINAQVRYGAGFDVEEFFIEFNDLMSRMDEKGQAAFVEMLSKFNPKQMSEFMKMSQETKEIFLGHFFTKEAKPEINKKDLREWFSEVKKIVFSGVETVIATLGMVDKKLNEKFAPGTELYNFAQRLESFSKKI